MFLIFTTTYIGADLLLDEHLVGLSEVGLVINANETKVMTTPQPPSFLSTPARFQWLKREFVWPAGGGKLGRSFPLWGYLRELEGAEHWRIRSCSPTQSSIVSVREEFLTIVCIGEIIVRCHPVCLKWVARPWHTTARSKQSQNHVMDSVAAG